MSERTVPKPKSGISRAEVQTKPLNRGVPSPPDLQRCAHSKAKVVLPIPPMPSMDMIQAREVRALRTWSISSSLPTNEVYLFGRFELSEGGFGVGEKPPEM